MAYMTFKQYIFVNHFTEARFRENGDVIPYASLSDFGQEFTRHEYMMPQDYDDLLEYCKKYGLRKMSKTLKGIYPLYQEHKYEFELMIQKKKDDGVYESELAELEKEHEELMTQHPVTRAIYIGNRSGDN